MKKALSFTLMMLITVCSFAQDIKNNPGSNHGNRFEQLGGILPSPNEFRRAFSSSNDPPVVRCVISVQEAAAAGTFNNPSALNIPRIPRTA